MEGHTESQELQTADIIIGSISLLFFILNFYQTVLDFVIIARRPWGSLQRLLHPLLLIGAGILSLGAFIQYKTTTGKLIVGSQSCNEILAFLLNIALTRTALVHISIAYKTNRLQRSLRWPRWALIFLNTVTVVLWILSIIIMFEVDNQTRWRAMSYTPNGITLIVLAIVLLFSGIYIFRNVQTVSANRRTLCGGRFSYDQSLVRTWILLSLILAVAIGVGAYTLVSAARVLDDSHVYISKEPKSESSLQSACITRAVALAVIGVFTYRMWGAPPSKTTPSPNENPRVSAMSGRDRSSITSPHLNLSPNLQQVQFTRIRDESTITSPRDESDIVRAEHFRNSVAESVSIPLSDRASFSTT